MSKLLTPETDAAAIRTQLRQPSTLCVACLCAEWCSVCREYRLALTALANTYSDTYAEPNICFVWIDIETYADWLGDLDIDTFPTILIEDANRTRFFGAVSPQPQTVKQLLDHLQALPTVTNIDVPKLRAWLT